MNHPDTRCQHPLDLTTGSTETELHRRAVERAVDAAFERLRAVRERAGMRETPKEDQKQ